MNNTFEGKKICLTFHGNVVHLFDPDTQNNLAWGNLAKDRNEPINDGISAE